MIEVPSLGASIILGVLVQKPSRQSRSEAIPGLRDLGVAPDDLDENSTKYLASANEVSE